MRDSSKRVLTALSLVLGFLTLSVSTALLYSVGMSAASTGAEAQTITPQLLVAVLGTCGLGFATLSGYIVGLVAQRSPLAHAAAFSLILVVTWLALTVGDGSIMSGTNWPLGSVVNVAIALVGIMTGGWIRYAQTRSDREVGID